MSGDLWILKGSRQILENVHTQDQCAGHFCTIHNPAPGPWDDWEVRFLANMFMCRICPCGIAHPAVEDVILGRIYGLHDCCGACQCSIGFIDWERDVHGEQEEPERGDDRPL